MYATTLMVIVAMATAEVGKEEQTFSPHWGREVSPKGGDHLPTGSEGHTAVHATVEASAKGGLSSCGPGDIIFYVLSTLLVLLRSLSWPGQKWAHGRWTRGKEGGVVVTGSSTVTCGGRTRWGAASWGRKDKMRNVDIIAKWCEGWTTCMHEGSASYHTDILNSRAKERMGEGWTTCKHEGPTSCQANMGKGRATGNRVRVGPRACTRDQPHAELTWGT